MILRLRFRGSGPSETQRVDIPGAPGDITIAALRAVISRFLAPNASFQLSLNGKDVIMADEDSILQTVGLCTGDTLIVIVFSESQTNVASLPSATAQQDKRGEQGSLLASQPTDVGGKRYPLLLRLAIGETCPSSLPADTTASSGFEVVILLIHALMQEAGFQSHPSNTHIQFSKNRDISIQYTHSLCPTMPCFLKFQSTTMADGDEAGQSLLISASVGDQVYTHATTTVAVAPIATLHNETFIVRVPESFRVQFRNHVAGPITLALLSPSSLSPLPSLSPPSLIVMTGDIKLNIASSVSLPILARLSCTCREFYAISMHDSIWKRHYLEATSSAVQSLPNGAQSWRQALQQLIIERKEEERQRRLIRESLYFAPAPNPLGFYGGRRVPEHPGAYTPGIIGGDYDLLPPTGWLPGGPLAVPPRGMIPGYLDPMRPPYPGFYGPDNDEFIPPGVGSPFNPGWGPRPPSFLGPRFL